MPHERVGALLSWIPEGRWSRHDWQTRVLGWVSTGGWGCGRALELASSLPCGVACRLLLCFSYSTVLRGQELISPHGSSTL